MANDEQLDPVEQVFLHAYPNPDRIGCPGDAIIRAVAQKKLPLDHPAREHLAKCSPCYADFKRFQQETRQRATAIQTVRGIAALLILGVLSWLWLSRFRDEGIPPETESPEVAQPRQPTEGAPARVAVPDSDTVAVLNLEGLSSTRGARELRVQPELQRLPRKSRVSLSIYLPRGSEEGRYEIRLLRNAKQLDQPVRSYEGSARIQSGLTVLPIGVDFSALQPGTYVLAFRHRDESWHFGRVALE